MDDPNPAHRSNYMPVKFSPGLNPFYCALPYNDKAKEGHRPGSVAGCSLVQRSISRPRGFHVQRPMDCDPKGTRTAYAQWEDAGPFRTDHWQYVFGNERPKPNLNKGAGLDVSPAVRDYLGLQPTDVTDWRFVSSVKCPAVRGQRMAKTTLSSLTIAQRARRSLND